VKESHWEKLKAHSSFSISCKLELSFHTRTDYSVRRQYRYQKNNHGQKQKIRQKAHSSTLYTRPLSTVDADADRLPSINPSEEIAHSPNVALTFDTSCALALDGRQEVGQRFLDLVFVHPCA